jgi:hypothetical protein
MRQDGDNAVMGLTGTCMGWTEPCTPTMGSSGVWSTAWIELRTRSWRTSWGAWWEDKIIMALRSSLASKNTWCSIVSKNASWTWSFTYGERASQS